MPYGLYNKSRMLASSDMPTNNMLLVMLTVLAVFLITESKHLTKATEGRRTAVHHGKETISAGSWQAAGSMTATVRNQRERETKAGAQLPVSFLYSSVLQPME